MSLMLNTLLLATLAAIITVSSTQNQGQRQTNTTTHLCLLHLYHYITSYDCQENPVHRLRC